MSDRPAGSGSAQHTVDSPSDDRSTLTRLIDRYGRLPLVTSVAFGISAVLLAVAAISDNPTLFFAAWAVNYVTDWHLRLRGRVANAVLRRFGFGDRLREFNRLMLLVLLAVVNEMSGVTVFALLVTVYFSANGSHAPLIGYRNKRRNVPVAVLNMDMSELKVPAAPDSAKWRQRGLTRVPGPEILLAAAAAAVLAGFGVGWLALAGAATLVTLVAAAQLALYARQNRRIPEAPEIIEVLNRRLAEYRPEVALYFTFAATGQDFMYQVNMWIDTLEKLDRRAIIILRETAAMAQLDRTRLPVVCTRKADDLALLDLSDLRVVLYPGNAGKNVHMLQKAEAQHVFIGHGDSDKLASSNRVSRVFDEIWVAGQGGRDRYQRVRHAIDPDSLVSVGRPQLSEVLPATAERTPGPLTVLYGPTWEGWTDEACHTSLLPMGERIIGGLLARDDIRVIYKPHPLTGKRSPEVERIDAQVRRLLHRDNERRAARRDPEHVAATDRRLAEIEARIAEISGRSEDGDWLQWTRDARWESRDVRAEIAELRTRWSELFWDEAYQGGRHLVVTDRLPSLYDCFNHADLLISDMSSVISDFVASCKPYVVTNAHDEDPEQYRLLNPTAGAAYLLGSDCAELDDILGTVAATADDPLAQHRVELKRYLLGPDEPSAMTQFNNAVESLHARALRAYPLGTTAEPVPAAPAYSRQATGLIPRQATERVPEALT
ncbi:hypothetical protein [Streptomyces bohaiensis]|uniref:CDP-glycerol glycerophosphotransferase n=1 Tax=Streptomyces bohaiensis TaxID=1431344 RepID=A0ABX1CE39_9ACTN|nr:hypothetical protein [Streptomyces bohaiensis]NJQ16586.1 hypothetical protein [Streptomyces bohaiensis]